jgi:hypothetical protein
VYNQRAAPGIGRTFAPVSKKVGLFFVKYNEEFASKICMYIYRDIVCEMSSECIKDDLTRSLGSIREHWLKEHDVDTGLGQFYFDNPVPQAGCIIQYRFKEWTEG